MMHFKKKLAACGAFALVLVAAGFITCALVSGYPAEAAGSHAYAGGSYRYYSANDNQWKYTKADYEFAVGMMTSGYENLSVAEFGRRFLDWRDEDAFHKGEERMERLLSSYPSDKPNAAFIETTLRASYLEACSHHYGGSCTKSAPIWWADAERTEYEDVFGDKLPVLTAYAGYNIKYRIADEEKLTVAQRDKALAEYRTAVQAYLDTLSQTELAKEKVVGAALEKELVRLDKALSTANLTLTSELGDYSLEDYREW